MSKRLVTLAITTALAATAALTAPGLTAPARAEALAICDDGGPGNTSQAAPKVEQFLRHMERSAGLSEGTFSGEYHTEHRPCVAYVKSASPAVGVFDLATLLRHQAAWKLKPVAHVGEADSVRYHVLVRRGTIADLAGLAGKTVTAAVPNDAAFLGKVLLEGKADVAGWKVTYTGRPLKAVRDVAREKADAAVVDHETFLHLADLSLPVELVSIHDSPALPGLTMVSVGDGGADLVRKISAALPKLCQGDGAELCKQLKVKAMKPADAGRYEALSKAYGR